MSRPVLTAFQSRTLEQILAGARTCDGVADAIYDLEWRLEARWPLGDFLYFCRGRGLSTAPLEEALAARGPA
jgi:hypothetical protein